MMMMAGAPWLSVTDSGEQRRDDNSYMGTGLGKTS